MKCPTCSTENRRRANHCLACGSRLPGATSLKAWLAASLALVTTVGLLGVEVLMVIDWPDDGITFAGGIVAAILGLLAVGSAGLALLALRDLAAHEVTRGGGLATFALVVVLVGLVLALGLEHVTLSQVRDAWWSASH